MQACRAKLVKLKVANPSMRFRLESNACTKEALTTASIGESGLEAPDAYWVELDVYEERYGKANPDQIVFEEPEPGTGLKAGVSSQSLSIFLALALKFFLWY